MADPITALPPAPSRADPANFSDEADALLGALDEFVTETNAVAVAMNLNDTSDVSSSSVLIGLGAKTFTVTADKSFLPGMYLVIADDAAPSTNSMVGQITSYSGTTLIMNITAISGSGTKSAWTISQSVPFSTIVDTLQVGVLSIAGDSISTINNNTDPGREILQIYSLLSTADGAGINLYGNGDPDFSGLVKIYAGGLKAVSILPSGNFGIGESVPDAKLDINGTMMMFEQAAAVADASGKGQFWVNSSGNIPMYTNEGGQDYTINITSV